MDTVTRVQILDEAACISHRVNTNYFLSSYEYDRLGSLTLVLELV